MESVFVPRVPVEMLPVRVSTAGHSQHVSDSKVAELLIVWMLTLKRESEAIRQPCH